jgi:hypothetical protein
MTPFDPNHGRDWCARTPAEAVEHDAEAVSRLVRWVEWDTVCVWCLGPIRADDPTACHARGCRHVRGRA